MPTKPSSSPLGIPFLGGWGLGSLYCPLVAGRGTVPSPRGSRHGRPLSVPGGTVPVGLRSPRLHDGPRLPMGGPRAWSRSPVKLDGRGVPMNSAHVLVTVCSHTPLFALDVPSLPQLSPVQPVAGSLDRRVPSDVDMGWREDVLPGQAPAGPTSGAPLVCAGCCSGNGGLFVLQSALPS